jgi:hypothetical protein
MSKCPRSLWLIHNTFGASLLDRLAKITPGGGYQKYATIPALDGVAEAHGLSTKPRAASGPGPANTWVLPHPPSTGAVLTGASVGSGRFDDEAIGGVAPDVGGVVFEQAATNKLTAAAPKSIRLRIPVLNLGLTTVLHPQGGLRACSRILPIDSGLCQTS